MANDAIKNIKDINALLPSTSRISEEYKGRGLSYTKSNKLVTALYMVTDIMDRDEPIRNKLRVLGVEIISNTHNSTAERSRIVVLIDEMLSFLSIAVAMNFISEMNNAILQKEFLDLQKSVKEFGHTGSIWIEKFVSEQSSSEDEDNDSVISTVNYFSKLKHPVHETKRDSSKGHTRLGVQKGSTLLQAITDMSNKSSLPSIRNDFDMLKKERRFNIVNVIKNQNGNVSIKDIKDKLNIMVSKGHSYSEKMIQRELLSMTKDGVLSKTGEKRWSRYSLKNQVI